MIWVMFKQAYLSLPAGVSCALVLLLQGGPVYADASEVQELRDELKALREEVEQLRAEQRAQQTRLDDDRAVYERALERSRQDDLVPLFAGINDKGRLFLSSRDGSVTAEFNGLIQLRYLWNTLDTNNATGTRSRSQSGISINRVRFGVSGDFGDGWGYKVQFGTARSIGSPVAPGTAPANGEAAGDVLTEDAYITYDFDDAWQLRAGSARLAFSRQELVSATRQVGVDRGLVNEFFTLNRSDHVQLGYKGDSVWGRLTLSDGGNANFSGAFSDGSNDFALTGRVDWMLSGDGWSSMRDEFARDDSALFLGGAVHYEVAEGGAAPDNQLVWTADALLKRPGYGLTAAVFGNHAEIIGAADADQYGLYLQGDVRINKGWSVFARWEAIDDGDFTAAGTDMLQALTAGFNRRLNSNVRLTTDLVWVYTGDNQTPSGAINGGELSSGLGLSSTAFNAGDQHGDQFAFRVQLQLGF